PPRPFNDRVDHAVRAVAAPVDHADAIGLRVEENEERVAELVHADDGILLEHRRHVIALDLDHPGHARSLCLNFGVGDWRLLRSGAILELFLRAVADAARALA